MSAVKYRLTTALILSLSGFVPGTALAQDVEIGADEVFELAPIIIRGELQGREIQDSPTSVAVATGEQLERRGDKDLLDFIERAPNVSTSLGQKGFQIRGVDQRGPSGAGIGLVISTQVDGVAMPDNQATFFAPLSTWDVEQIEVLRGPQSTQQGRNALAGAIVVRSKDPTYEREAKLRGELGSRSTLGGALMVNAPIIEDKLAFRFSAETLQSDGTIKNPTLGVDDYDARELTTYRAKLRFDPTDDIETILSYTYSDHSGGEDFVQSALFPGQRVNLSDVRGEEGTKSHNLGLRVNWDLNDRFRLESETTYYKDDYYRLEDIDQSAADEGALSVDARPKCSSRICACALIRTGSRVLWGCSTPITRPTAPTRLMRPCPRLCPPSAFCLVPSSLRARLRMTQRSKTSLSSGKPILMPAICCPASPLRLARVMTANGSRHVLRTNAM